jgi:large subunit ribosomal protein L16
MLQPKRTKYRKQFKGRNTGLAQRGSHVAFGEFGLKATERARMTAREIEAARRAMARAVKRGGQIWVRVFPTCRYRRSPSRSAWAAGKGNVEYWVAKVQPGKVLFEMEGVPESHGPRGVPPCRRQALGGHDLREAAGALMKVSEMRGKSAQDLTTELVKPAQASSSRCVCSAPPARPQARPVRQGAQEHCAPEDRAARAARQDGEQVSMAEAAGPEASRTLTGTRRQQQDGQDHRRRDRAGAEARRRYGKYIRRTTRLLAHDEAGQAREGDTVSISPLPADVAAQVVAAGVGARTRRQGLKA